MPPSRGLRLETHDRHSTLDLNRPLLACSPLFLGARVRVIVAIVMLIVGLAVQASVAEAHPHHDTAVNDSHHHGNDAPAEHDPSTHSHPLGEDVLHQMMFHWGVDSVEHVGDFAYEPLPGPLQDRVSLSDDACRGSEFPPPLRPPLA